MTSLTKDSSRLAPTTFPEPTRASESWSVAELLAARDTRRGDGTFGFMTVALVVLDALVLFVALVGMNWLRHPKDGSPDSVLFFLLPLGILFTCLYLIDGYKVRSAQNSSGYATQHVLAVGIALLLTLFVSYVVFHEWASVTARRGNIAISFLAFIPLSLAYRRIFSQRVLQMARRSSVFFLGTAAAAREFYTECAKYPEIGKVVYATAGGDAHQEIAQDGTRLERLDLSLFEEHDRAIGAVICAEDANHYPGSILQLLMNLRLRSVPVFTCESFYEARLRKIPSSSISPLWLFKEGFRIAHDPVYLHVKRLSDICLASLGLIVTSPVFLVVAAAVKLTSPRGPVFFRQLRVGLNNKPFSVYKFRTMKVGSEKGNAYTQTKDPRLTPIGGLLRKCRIDELPQLWNVLKGDMSLIGPRAEWDKLVNEYEKHIPFYHFRHMVKPGITGWAQVNYPYGANLADTIEKLEYDLYYIRHFSFVLDASIVLKTIHTMLFGKGR